MVLLIKSREFFWKGGFEIVSQYGALAGPELTL